MRLQKYLAECGVASRRKSEELIAEGHVTVNGQVVRAMGIEIDPQKDEVCFDKKPLHHETKKVYLAFHKPKGMVTTAHDPQGRLTVMDAVADAEVPHLHPVGRLDYDTSGLLLLTNDGDMTYRATHPKHEIEKTYRALVRGFIPHLAVELLKKGVRLDGYTTRPAKVEIVKMYRASTELLITIHEGKNRQVRKMCAAVGYPVIELERIQFGPVRLGNLLVGQWRKLRPSEVQALSEVL